MLLHRRWNCSMMPLLINQVCDMFMHNPVWTAACMYSLLSGPGTTSLPFACLACAAGVTGQSGRHTAQPSSWGVQTHLCTSHALFSVYISLKMKKNVQQKRAQQKERFCNQKKHPSLLKHIVYVCDNHQLFLVCLLMEQDLIK